MAHNAPDPGRNRVGGESAAAVVHTPKRIWAMVAVIILGFTLAAVSLPMDSVLLRVVGIAVFVVGCVGAWAFGIMSNVH
jgi:hypothetical protein